MQTKSFYVVRVTTQFQDDTIPEEKRSRVRFVGDHYNYAAQYGLRDFNDATRFESVSKAKKALRYACVRDALDSTRARDPLRRRAKWSKHQIRQIKTATTAEVVKITVRYQAEVMVIEPKPHPLEHLALAAG